MHGYESMTKRKRDIFTVIEVVPNWFEAGEGSDMTPEEGAEDTNWVQDQEGQSVYVAGEVVDGSATWAQGHEGQSVYVAGESSAGVASWAQSHGTVQITTAGTNLGSEVQSQPTLVVEVTDWLRAARLPVTGPSVGPEPVATETLDETEHRSLNALWSLLQVVGYEEW